MKQERFYTAKELATILKLDVVTIYRNIRSGKLKAHKIGKEFRIDQAEFEQFLNKTQTK
ncbi:MAG: helix-turn-helix domain-containing protein [Patescibacteria group bacterium]